MAEFRLPRCWRVRLGPNIRRALASRVLDTAERWQKLGFHQASGVGDRFLSRLMRATKHWANRGSLFAGPNLRYAIAWEQQEKPSRAWCARYGGDFDLMKRFLGRSSLRESMRSILRQSSSSHL
jgi:hypothetical protein